VGRPLEVAAGRVNVLGVGVDPLTVEDLHAEIGRLVRGRGRGLVLNANAHCLHLCHEDPALRAFFNGAEVVFCDGVGVMLAARILGGRIPERITYADWAWRLAAFAAAEGFSLFFLGARRSSGGGEEAQREAPWIRDLGHPPRLLRPLGGEPGERGRRRGDKRRRPGYPPRRVRDAAPGVLVAGERAQARRRRRPHRRRAVFDYVSGKLSRGPRLLTGNGFEWLARLLVEPRRLWRRYLIGNPLFLLRVVKQRLGF
jgi:N-acetylglucosaminyldiphosphoundecaprenol N-acetyl-beta-D-mannosaminyltransferase